MYGAIVTVWIVLPVYEISLSFVATDIVKGTCIPWGVYSSYAVERAVSTLLLLSSYVIPLVVIGFCYSKIIYVLRRKVFLFIYLIRQMAANSKIHNQHRSQ